MLFSNELLICYNVE